MLLCAHCNSQFAPHPAVHRHARKQGRTYFFCTLQCAQEYRKVRVTRACEHCAIPVTRQPSDFAASGRVFCSKRCAARHRGLARGAILGARTKGEIFAARDNWQSARNAIQKLARAIFFAAHPQPICGALVSGAPCGYSKHIEVCHRRDVAAFPDEALLSAINHIDNLVGLCPTHHWEFDHDAMDAPLPIGRHR